ncbi:putative 28S ribosomal protein S26 like protein [Argiope bruennichi]|uniref:Small ribosomal subunit protein mS26 n=1 Tax=Argiope bruennichi TaxID=94029 RepID=A0A8T0EMH1_ARGBR|nr:putative 28S ribosomal protein S26 like protein [Argiope bruennichi]
MSFLYRSYLPSILKLHEVRCNVPYIFVQLRWKKIPIRKPRWLPMAPSKLFRIPEHPYVPPDEKQLIEDLLDEYYRKIESLRKLFKEELAQKSRDEGHTVENQRLEEEKFLLLLEENKKENERLQKLREETMEKNLKKTNKLLKI